ncbi:indole-3-glycerol phosphate synthase TrpC [Chloroflexus sp.]|uniref:indole-3-glycerol phosphate synthase TrpC n=1 Tax=Chloroflexus sp. TaxID=1904827 RepID=UPI00263481D1|nr:indole-3-glycerol phosphate synthase TrpC [uncultured Chloroflexus sp.]
MSESTILEQILAHKRIEVRRQQAKIPLAALQDKIHRAPPARDFAAALRRAPATALIAEVKKASPSRGVLLANFDHLALARAYVANGAAAISVLTDQRFFQGSLTYLAGIRALPEVEASGTPLLRKDFIIDPYQVYEARAYGADAILLIVAALDDLTLAELFALTGELGMQALIEVHTTAELERTLRLQPPIIGVNNRDLHRFLTDRTTTKAIAERLPAEPQRPLLVSESGIFSPEHVAEVRAYGADAILVGEALVTAPDIGAHARALANA